VRVRLRSAVRLGALALPCVIWCSSAKADVAATPAARRIPLELAFTGAPGCDEAQTLRREVERRSDVVLWVSDGTSAGSAEVRITSGFSRYEAEIVVNRPGVSSVTRVITSSSCREAVESAALVIAVVLSASVDSEPPLSSFPPLERPQAQPLRRDSLRWELGVGASALTLFGVAPSNMVGFEAFGDASSYRTGWAPAIRLGFRHTERRYFALPGEGAQVGFRLDSGRLAACPIAWLVSETFLARACAVGHFGRVGATAYGGEIKRDVSHPWVGLGGALRLEARVLSDLSLELEGGYEATLLASRFSFSGRKFHESSRRIGEIGVSLVARVPQ
jgi:hypothetical protein